MTISKSSSSAGLSFVSFFYAFIGFHIIQKIYYSFITLWIVGFCLRIKFIYRFFSIPWLPQSGITAYEKLALKAVGFEFMLFIFIFSFLFIWYKTCEKIFCLCLKKEDLNCDNTCFWLKICKILFLAMNLYINNDRIFYIRSFNFV